MADVLFIKALMSTPGSLGATPLRAPWADESLGALAGAGVVPSKRLTPL